MTESVVAARTARKLNNFVPFRLDDKHDQQLCDAIATTNLM
jgi:hypothetical protein